MPSAYKALEVTSPGKFNLVQREVVAPKSGQVRIRVQACGVCHSDSAAVVRGQWPGMVNPAFPATRPLVLLRRLDQESPGGALDNALAWVSSAAKMGPAKPGRPGDFVNCLNPIYPGRTTDGGYAEMLIAESRALALIPDDLSSTDAAPLVYARITTFNSLRNAGLRAGSTVAIQGIGALGRFGVQFANRMGFRVVVIGSSADKQNLAHQLGAHVYTRRRLRMRPKL